MLIFQWIKGDFLITFLILGVIFWPFWNSLVTGVFGYYLGTKQVRRVSIIGMFLSAFFSWILFFVIVYGQSEATLVLSSSFNLRDFYQLSDGIVDMHWSQRTMSAVYAVVWALHINASVSIMMMVVTTISAAVHYFASSYLSEDPHQARFFSHLSLFTGFMLVLVTADNLFQLFAGWEGVGICSYLLIGFWYQRVQAVKAAMQALVVNKVGDVALFIAVCLIFIKFHTTRISAVAIYLSNMNSWSWYAVIGEYQIDLWMVVNVCFFIAAVAKSAQIGLHTWLLSAMEGPTPVSALLHAATMVTAGIFLMIRCQWLLQPNGIVFPLMVVWGATTAFFAALCGLVQHDIKKVIAFSTCSQLGYMFYACGLGEFNACLFHLTNHAFFKALLFMCAGAVIHALNGEQDLRRMGGLAQVMPVTFIAMSIASLALIGFPFLSGFYSKDVLIELAFSSSRSFGLYAFWLASLSACLTAFYSMRLLYWVFLSKPNFYKSSALHLYETDSIMLGAFRPLLLGSLFSGYLLRDLFVGMGQNSFASTNAGAANYTAFSKSTQNLLLNQMSTEQLTVWRNTALIEMEFIPVYIKLIPVVLSLLGVMGALYLYTSTERLLTLVKLQMNNSVINSLYAFFVKKGYFDIIYNHYIARPIYKLGWWLYKYGDQGVFEWLGPQGIYYVLSQKLQVTWITLRSTPLTLETTSMVFTKLVFASGIFLVFVFAILL
jgi:proton-translocating NADH-quinone oxidoreductase chain L